MEQIGALIDVHLPVGRDRQAELFQRVSALSMRVVLVHQGKGLIEQRSILLHQTDNARIEQLHVAVGQPAGCKPWGQVLVQPALLVVTKVGADGIAQQCAWLDAPEQFDG
ncbi:hypothetical protein D3C77_496550 [compost metagenome]